MVTRRGRVAGFVRTKVVPRLAPLLFRLPPFRLFLFRTASQTAVNYRQSRLSEGKAGGVRGGDRLPWVTVDSNHADNFTPLASLDWQVHVYGGAAPGIQAMCRERTLPLHVLPWRLEMDRAGLRRNAVYLVRPDGYVALADPKGSTAAITSYLDARKLRPGKRD